MDGYEKALLVFSAGIPVLVMWGISRGGWSALAARYPGTAERPKALSVFGYGTLSRYIGYNGCLIIGADEKGLHLATWPVLASWCHAPVFIPWTQVADLRARRRWWRVYYRLDLKGAPDVDLALSAGDVGLLRPWLEKAGIPVVEL